MVEKNVTPIHGGRNRNRRANLPEPVEALLNAWQRFGAGRGNSHSNGGGGDGPPKAPQLAFLLIIFVGLILWAVLSSFYTVDISEEAVVTRFGAYQRTTGPGMQFKLPFGIEQVRKVQSKRILQEEFGFRTAGATDKGSVYDKGPFSNESLMLTGDLNVADVEWILQYRIADPWKFLFHARDVPRNIRDVSLSIMRRVVGDRLVGGVLTTARVEIAVEAKELTQEVLDRYDMGVKVERIILQDVNPPEKVKPAFNEVNAAKQDQEKTINVAERQYNRVIPEARGKAEQLIADAEAYAISTVNRARGDTAQFDAIRRAYEKAPQVTRDRLYLDAMAEVFGSVKNFTIIDKNLEGIIPLYPDPTSAQGVTTDAKVEAARQATGQE